MSATTQLTVRLPDRVVAKIYHEVFMRRVAKAPGRAASRSSIVAEILATATLTPVSKGEQP